ncbi:hypothetical protein B6V77_02145 [Staphylococcus aureus]|nr:hypothetical protein B6V77_02145 [Staphylococcus aureus]
MFVEFLFEILYVGAPELNSMKKIYI